MKTLSEAELAAIRDRDHIFVEAFRGRLTIIEADRHSLIAHIDALNARIAELETTIDRADEHTAGLVDQLTEKDARIAELEVDSTWANFSPATVRTETATAILRAAMDRESLLVRTCGTVTVDSLRRICKEHGGIA